MAVISVLLIGLTLLAGCGPSDSRPSARIAPEYDKTTGRLRLLKYDANGDGIVDTWSYMDGTRVVRIEIDSDQDGQIDRWEYYGPNQKLERVGLSPRHDGKPSRTEYYEGERIVRAEESSRGDGAIDRWETYEGGRLSAVAFDTEHRGRPDRRFVYSADGQSHFDQIP